MAGSKVNMRNFEKAMKKAIEEVESTASMRALGEEMKERIKKRVRLGKGVAQQGAEAQPLKPLSSSYRAQRAGKIAFAKGKQGQTYAYKPDERPELSPTTTPAKSNLTRTGQMLDSLKVVSAVVGRALIAPTGGRKGGLLTNKEVAEYVSAKRPFLNLSKAELNGLARLIRDRIEQALKKNRS